MQEWYLFPDLVATGVNKANFNSVQSYIDALVAPARAQSKDRFFSYITSIQEENAFFEQGASAGFGFRLGFDQSARRVFVIETFEGTAATAAMMERGSEILAVGTSQGNLQPVNGLMAAGGSFAVVEALGPATAGTVRWIQFRDAAGQLREQSLTKTVFDLDPVSDRYGSRIFTEGNRKIGYLNLRTFINSAAPDLIEAYGDFRAQGVTELIIDFRYNGGGLISIAELMGDLMGEGRAGQVFDYIAFRPSKSFEDSEYRFNPLPQSIAPMKIAFIGTEGTASASEMVINGMQPYIGNGLALIGSNTFGKPVGQIALDRAACDDRLRLVALRVENANREGEYYTGLASTVPNSCAVQDDITRQLGDPDEGMIRTAMDFLAGRSCTAIGSARTAQTITSIEVLQQRSPTLVQRHSPGVF